jgi:tetrahydromethanopterin S-methyltransferase subunit F
MLVAVEVGVALSRPPKVDRISRQVVEVDYRGDFLAELVEAELIACQMAHRPDVVMPVYSRVDDILEL